MGRMVSARFYNFIIFFIAFFSLQGCFSGEDAQPDLSLPSIEKAKMLRDHGLIEKSKSDLISIIFGEYSYYDKAEAHYFLGMIAFDEGNFSAAIDSWREIERHYPESDQANIVGGKLAHFSGEIEGQDEALVKNAVASSYIRSGDFWSASEREGFGIVAPFAISRFDAAEKWYNMVISEFPGSGASRIAYERKFSMYLNRRDPGKNLPQLIEVMEHFERDHPDALRLQAFRYLIAREYLEGRGDRKNAIKWLERIIENSGEQDSFHRDLAERHIEALKR